MKFVHTVGIVVGLSVAATGGALAETKPSRDAAKVMPKIEKLTTQSEFRDVTAILGEPDRDVGSGIHVYLFRLSDGTELRVGTPDDKDIMYIDRIRATRLGLSERGAGAAQKNEGAKGEGVLDLRTEVLVETKSPDGKLRAVYYRDGWDEVIAIRDAATNQELKRIVGHGDNVKALKFTPDGRQLASRCAKKGFALWDVSTGKLLLRLPKK